MPIKSGAFRNEALGVALDSALKGSPRALYDLLGRLSGLPGKRANMGLVEAFATECSLRGAPTDRIIVTMAQIDADSAPGGTELEIIPMCGVMAAGERGATDPQVVDRALVTLHDAADDLRFRVRDCVPVALAKIGAVLGDKLLPRVDGWMDGYFHAAAVLLALADQRWLSTLTPTAAARVVEKLDQAFELLVRAERAASRYPGYKALVDAVGLAPAAVAGRFGVPVFDAMVGWCKTNDSTLRDAILLNLKGSRLVGRYAKEIARVEAALAESAPVRRDPTTFVGRTRGRGRKR